MNSEKYFESDTARIFWEVKQHIRRAFSSDWGLAFSSADVKKGKVVPVNTFDIREAGFNQPIVLSSFLYERFIKPYAGHTCAEADFLSDMLWLLRFKTAGCNASKMNFKAGFKTSNGEQKDISLKVIIGPYEKVETGPVMKIMLHSEKM